jgi:hypothetical protein
MWMLMLLRAAGTWRKLPDNIVMLSAQLAHCRRGVTDVMQLFVRRLSEHRRCSASHHTAWRSCSA